jgi:hypothetical protein
MNNFDKFILVVLVLNCVLSAVGGNWDAVFGWAAATCFFLIGAKKKEEGV